jgi:hypothetical protein
MSVTFEPHRESRVRVSSGRELTGKHLGDNRSQTFVLRHRTEESQSLKAGIFNLQECRLVSDAVLTVTIQFS